MTAPVQTYANHRALPSSLFIAAFLVLVVNVVWQGIALFSAPGFGSVLGLLVALALVLAMLVARRGAQIIQDRIIRLEMQVRLQRVLPVERQADVARLTLSQMVALRFASDAELPGLVQEALAQSLSNDAIKRKINNWQADWLRV
jgi:Family of unknown function (DUF6526)